MIEKFTEEYLSEYCIVMHSGGGTDRNYLSGLSFKEANEICESMNWEFIDENCFVWDLSIEEY